MWIKKKDVSKINIHSVHPLLHKVRELKKIHEIRKEENMFSSFSKKENISLESLDKFGKLDKNLKGSLDHFFLAEFNSCFWKKVNECDLWAAEIFSLVLSDSVRKLALNSWKEILENGVCLHLRSSKFCSNLSFAKKVLSDALSKSAGKFVEVTIIKDDDLNVLTPLDWYKVIYEEKLMQVRKLFASDSNLKKLCDFFDSNYDEETIQLCEQI